MSALEKTWTHEGRPELNRRDIKAPDGPWWSEPDKIQFVDPSTGLDCLMVRNHFGVWCGYVGLTEGHPWFGFDCGHYLDLMPGDVARFPHLTSPDEIYRDEDFVRRECQLMATQLKAVA